MNSQSLLLLFEEDYFGRLYNNYIRTDIILKKVTNPILLVIRRIYLKLNLPFFHIWFNQIDMSNVKVIILFDTIYTPVTALYLRKINPTARIIVFFRNHIEGDVLKKFSNTIELWSYDTNDCVKYGLKHNSQFYFNELSRFETNEYPIKYDVLFVGKEKGRYKDLCDLKESLEKQGVICYFYIIGNSRKERGKLLPYKEVVKLIKQSKCVLDILPPQQHGMSLRPLEAMFMRKKLITNYVEIKDCLFYSSHNILLLEKNDDIIKAKDFLGDEIVECDYSYYSFQNWLQRLLID